MGVYVLQPLALKVRVEPPPSLTTIKNQLFTSIKNQVLAEKVSALDILIKIHIIMEKKVVNLSVKQVSIFNDKNDRLKLGFVFNETFEARKADRETGEFVIKDDNQLSFTKKQFNFMLQDNFVITVLSQQLNYSALQPIEVLAMFRGAELTVERTRLEQGDTYININGEEASANDTIFITEIKDIEFNEKNITAIKKIIVSQAKAEGKDIDANLLDLLF
nr:MAG TPA: hypothetical protein [Crassvirales sp.]